MPKISGKEIISENTEKLIRRGILTAAIAIAVKAYNVELDNLRVFEITFPSALFDTIFLVLIGYFSYTFIVSWVGDLMGFRLWFKENSITSQFGTEMKLDKEFLSGGLSLLTKLYEKEKGVPSSDETQLGKEFEEFRLNVGLYITRLEYAGLKFRTLSTFGHFYVWFQSFFIPLFLNAIAAYMVLRYGTILPPVHY